MLEERGPFHDRLHLFVRHDRNGSGAVSPDLSEPAMHEDSDEEEFVYPGVVDPAEEAEEESPKPDLKPEPLPVAAAPVPAKSPPSPAQLEALHAAATSGELSRVQTVFRSALKSGDVESFALANDAPSRIGQTALHAASSRGYLDIVKWRTSLNCLFSECDPDSGHSCGGLWRHAGYRRQGGRGARVCSGSSDVYSHIFQTALHKASLHGHLHIVKYLLPDKADVHAQDADGWTALHNACSKVGMQPSDALFTR